MKTISIFGHNKKDNKTIMLNNAATTPPLQRTIKKMLSFLNEYGSFHRGAGPYATKTHLETNKALAYIKKFIGASKQQSLLFTNNTSGAINLFIRLLDLKKNDIIITSEIEHTSNNLPWQYNTKAKTIFTKAFDDGSIDYKDLEKKAKLHSNKLKLIAITGAASLSGYVPDIGKISKIAHRHKALLFIDAAQLAPHRPIDMHKQKIDALAFSAHKIYAPFGIGVLALPNQILKRQPVDPGGGSIDMITKKDIIWSSPEQKHQAGTWNVPGIIALGESCKSYMSYGWEKIIKHEQNLVNYMVEKLTQVPKIHLYFDARKYLEENRIGTFVFNIKGVHHALLSAILEHEYKIETRSGTICNHMLVRRWLKINDEQQTRINKRISSGNLLASYGIVRASLGFHNTKKDIDRLTKALAEIAISGHKRKYKALPKEGIYIPK